MKSNLIGISGKLNSGKDTVANIFRYLEEYHASQYTHPITAKDFQDYMESGWAEMSEWEIRRFADKLKDIVCLLIGCTREQLEDREFKERELGEEWDKWWLIEKWANDEGAEYDSDMYFNSEEELDTYVKEWGHSELTCEKIGLVKLTPRKLLQLIGTECGREIIHPNIWVNALFADYKAVETHKVPRYYDEVNKKGLAGYEGIWEYPKWIIPDMRFPNEVKAIKDRGGVLIRVNRPTELRLKDTWDDYLHSEFQEWDKYLKAVKQYDKVYHPSETALDNFKFDYVINNDGDLDDLIKKVERIYNE